MPNLQNVSAPLDINNINTFIGFQDSFAIDAFGRLRQSAPLTLFDSKQIVDNQPLLWADEETTGSGTDSTFDANRASSDLSVTTSEAGKRVRQTFQRFNYQPGKSQLIIMTGIIGSGASGITKGLGYFDDNNGLFFQNDEGTMKVVRRTYTSGSAVDNKVSQSSWNIDPMDGTGPSGYTIDWTKTQIFLIDFEWLGVGRVRMGMVIDGVIYYVHQFLNANNLDVVYMSTPNLPLRYELENDGTGTSSLTFEAICATVISEGGQQDTGVLRYASTAGTHVDADAANSVYAVVGIRQKSTHIDVSIILDAVSMITQTNDDFEWLVIINPSVAVTFTYNAVLSSAVEYAVGTTDNTVTGGTTIAGGFASATTGGSINANFDTIIRPGVAIDGTVDEIVLCVRPLSANADIEGSITWRELV